MTCPHCDYRFESPAALEAHIHEGRGCPELECS